MTWIRKISKGQFNSACERGSCLRFGVFVIIILSIPVSTLGYSVLNEHKCRPILTDTTIIENNFKQLECVISTCTTVSKIMYEKSGMHDLLHLTPVVEGINKTHYHALSSGDKYTLANRFYYTAFPTTHMLYIKPLLPEDQGKWRCVVYAENNITYYSETKYIGIYVTPDKSKMNIIPSNPALVTDQNMEFICIVDGIKSEAEVVWTVNGDEYTNGVAANSIVGNGLWFVNSTITLAFSNAGVNILTCAIKTQSRDPWLQHHISTDVKEHAAVTKPREEVYITVNRNSSFTLTCIGSGYKPTLSWMKDGNLIFDDNDRYNTKEKCNDDVCEGSITTQTDANTCSDKPTTVFTCVISIQPPYKSSQESPYMNVNLPQTQCGTPHLTNDRVRKIGIIALLILCGVLMTIIGVLVYRCRTEKCSGYQRTPPEEH